MDTRYIIGLRGSKEPRYSKEYDGSDSGWTSDLSEATRHTLLEILEVYDYARKHDRVDLYDVYEIKGENKLRRIELAELSDARRD